MELLSLVTFAAGIAALVIATFAMAGSDPSPVVPAANEVYCPGPSWYPMPEVHAGRDVEG